MNPVLLPAACFPPISWYASPSAGHPVIIEQWETFPKQTIRNRYDILTAGGRKTLVIPVSKPSGNHTLTRDVRICFREPWHRTHWRSIVTAYRSSPFFTFYEDQLSSLFENPDNLLIPFNLNAIGLLNRLIGINPDIRLTETFLKESGDPTDLRSNYKRGKGNRHMNMPAYPQVFQHLYGFTGELSILDLLFNLGPETRDYLALLRQDPPDQP
jgi:hypothetical protein